MCETPSKVSEEEAVLAKGRPPKNVGQKSGLMWLGDKTKLHRRQSQTISLLHQLFCNLFCSHRLTGSREKWRCKDINTINGKGHGTLQTLG